MGRQDSYGSPGVDGVRFGDIDLRCRSRGLDSLPAKQFAQARGVNYIAIPWRPAPQPTPVAVKLALYVVSAPAPACCYMRQLCSCSCSCYCWC